MSYSLNRIKLLLAAVLVSVFGLCFMLMTAANAANPATLSFQGKVVNANGTNVTDGTYSFVFKLYTVSSAGSALWTETDSTVSVAAGVFQVNLGAVCPFFTANACNSSTPIDFNANPTLYLGITFNGDPAGEMTPRVQLQSVPYAYNADKVGGLDISKLVQLTPAGGQQSGSVNVTSVISPSLTSTGALTINSGAATNVSIDSAGAGTAAINIGGTNATSVAVSRTGQTTTVNGALTVNENTNLNQTVIMTFNGTENLAITSDLAGSVNGLSFIGTPSATSGTTSGAFIQQANSANTNGLDSGLTIDNANTTLAITNGINFTNTGGGGYTNYITSPNFILTGTGNIFGKGVDYFDPSALTQATGSTGLGSGGTAGGNFGGATSTGAFINNTDTYGQEFVGSKASTTTNNTAVGDDSKWYYNNAGAGSAITAFSDVSTTGGFARLTTSTTSGRGGLITEGAVAGTVDAPLLAANLPIVQIKVRPSILRITDDMIWGMTDTATAPTANDAMPTNGIFFWTNNAIGATGWTGVVRSAGVNVGTVTCPGTATAGVFATGRIVVVNATTVRFFIDNDATNGVNFLDCGTVSGTPPSANMAMSMYVVQTTTTAATFDLDYARFWQDDAPPAAPTDVASAVSSEQIQADISTGSDSATNQVSQADVTSPVASTDTSIPAVQTVQTGSATVGNDYQVQLAAGGTSRVVNNLGKTVATIDDSGNANFAGNLDIVNATLSGGLSVGGDANFSGLSTFQNSRPSWVRRFSVKTSSLISTLPSRTTLPATPRFGLASRACMSVSRRPMTVRRLSARQSPMGNLDSVVSIMSPKPVSTSRSRLRRPQIRHLAGRRSASSTRKQLVIHCHQRHQPVSPIDPLGR